MRRRIHRWLQLKSVFILFAWLVTFAVVYLSLKPPSKDTVILYFLFTRIDLALHFICYFFVSQIYFMAFFTYSKTLIKAFSSALLLGLLMEIIQPLPLFNRNFDLLDICANFIGAALGIILIRFLFKDSLKD